MGAMEDVIWINKATNALTDAKERFEVLMDADEATPADKACYERICGVLEAREKL